MSCTIDIMSHVSPGSIDLSEVELFLQRIFIFLGIDEKECSLTFCDDEEIAELNMSYRKKEGPTDILSFVQLDSVDEDFPVDESILGDMIISLDTLKRNANYFNVSEDVELHRLLIHGVLHLIGMDHETNNSNEPMLILQEKILEDLLEKRVE